MLPRVACSRLSLGCSCLEHKEAEARQQIVVVFFLNRSCLRVLVAQRNEVPKSCALCKLRIELALQLLKQTLKLHVHVLHGAAVEQNKVENFDSFIDIFLPLRQLLSPCAR